MTLAMMATMPIRVGAAALPADEAERLSAALETGLTGYTYLADEPLA